MNVPASLADWMPTIGFVVAILAYSLILLRAAKWLAAELNRPLNPTVGATSPTIAQGMLLEKTPPAAPPAGGQAPSQAPTGSFSRVAGAMGAVALAALFASGGYWLLYSAFFTSSKDMSTAITGFTTYLLAGMTMFAPYAANQFSTIFKPS